MRYLLAILILFASCRSIPIDIPTPEYKIEEVVEAVTDSVKTPDIVVNNYILPPEEKEEKVMTPETFRFLILEISSLLSTIIAVIAIDNSGT